MDRAANSRRRSFALASGGGWHGTPGATGERRREWLPLRRFSHSAGGEAGTLAEGRRQGGPSYACRSYSRKWRVRDSPGSFLAASSHWLWQGPCTHIAAAGRQAPLPRREPGSSAFLRRMRLLRCLPALPSRSLPRLRFLAEERRPPCATLMAGRAILLASRSI